MSVATLPRGFLVPDRPASELLRELEAEKPCGHPDTLENTYTRPNGWSECRVCKRTGQARAKAKRRKPPVTLSARLLDRMSIGGLNECWFWQGAPDASGYGKVRVRGKSMNAHRAVYQWLVGEIPEGRMLHHVCEERRCVNPRHLIPVTQREHQEHHDYKGNRHAAEAWRTRSACIHGHEFTPENTRLTSEGHRKCRACDRERYRRRAALQDLRRELGGAA